jgi:pimeloyl-ACP methyl ester carboxylesterase
VTPLFERLSPPRVDWARDAVRSLVTRRGVRLRDERTRFGAMSFYELGAEHDGPPLVFLHVIASDALPLLFLAMAFAETRRCLLPDLFDFAGASRRFTSPRGHAPLDPTQHAESVVELLARLRVDAADFVGVSLGGWVALHLAATTPRARSLFLVNPAGLAMDVGALAALADTAEPGARHELARRVLGEEALFPAISALGGLMERLVKSALDTPEVRGFGEAIREEHFVDALLPKITCRTFVLAGTADTLLPKDGPARLVAAIPDATGEWVEGASHNLSFEAPGNVYLALRRFHGLTREPHATAGRLRLHARRLRPTRRIERTAP